MQQEKSKPEVLVFDINGTLLNTEALAPYFRRLFDSKYSVREWYVEVIAYSMATTIASQYRDFGDIAIATLQMAAKARHVRLSKTAIERIRLVMKQLPPFRDVHSSLRRLRKAGFRLAALSNSGPTSLRESLRHAKLSEYFEQTLSVELVGRFKPVSETYLAAAKSLGVPVRNITMIAAHPWDLMGAARAGCRTAFVARPGEELFPGVPSPTFAASNLSDLVDQLIGPDISQHLLAGLLVGGAATGFLAAGRNRLRYGG